MLIVLTSLHIFSKDMEKKRKLIHVFNNFPHILYSSYSMLCIKNVNFKTQGNSVFKWTFTSKYPTYFSSANSNSIINSQIIKVTRIQIFNVKVTKFDVHSFSHLYADFPFTNGAVGIGLWVVYGRERSTFRA